MTAPESAEVFETSGSTYWFEDDILYAVSKNAPELPFETVKKQTEEFIEKMQGKKLCLVIDVTNSSHRSKESREYSTQQLSRMFKGIAIIARTPLGKMFANLYLGFKPLPIPTKVFNNKVEAKEWIQQYR